MFRCIFRSPSLLSTVKICVMISDKPIKYLTRVDNNHMYADLKIIIEMATTV